MSQTTNDQLSKPIVLTIVMILIALPLQPIPGLDILYDIIAACFVGSKWMAYTEAAKQIASTVRPVQASPDATALYNAGCAAFKKSEYSEALRTFTLSAEAGNYNAMNHLGLMHHEGKGCPVNYALAAQWYEKAIVSGDRKHAPGNIERVGAAYFDGKKIPKNIKEAARLWRIAANSGLSDGQYDMGLLHKYGVGGVPEDKTLARHWYGLAAAQGHVAALEELKKLDGEKQGEQSQNTGTRNQKMTPATALELLELKEGATKAEMKKAYMRLMQNVHPDKGGSNYFAKQLNEAREVLGF